MTLDTREYNSVLLAALLHDIGKFLHRTRRRYKSPHEEISGKFISLAAKKLCNPVLYDLDLVKFIVENHHTRKTRPEVLALKYAKALPQEGKNRLWKLISVVRCADGYSCAERDQDQDRRQLGERMRRAPLDSIFTRLTLKSTDGFPAIPAGYRLKALDPLTAFPENIESLGDEEIEKLVEKFESDVPDFTKMKDFANVLNVWLDYLEKFTWAVPSDTRYDTSDVSLFDHLKSSAAIAACLYKKHLPDIESGAAFKRKREFVLIGGDFSGIQRYIFDITNIGSGGVSKRLRARSFFISMFSEITLHKILHALKLPLLCNLFSTGGKFLLLAPNLPGVEEALQAVKKDIEREIHTTFFGQFSFLMSWMPIEGFKLEFRMKTFFETADKMFYRLEREKTQAFQSVLANPGDLPWNPEGFKATKMYEKYDGFGDCRICGKGPGNLTDRGAPEEDGVACCAICYRDKNTIGGKLPLKGFVAFGRTPFKQPDAPDRVVIFRGEPDSGDNPADGNSTWTYYFELLDKPEDNPDYYVVYDIRSGDDDSFTFLENRPVRKLLANHVPIDTEGKVLDFEELAKVGRPVEGGRETENTGKDETGGFLGVLKADIDNLGLLFSKGFEKPVKEEAKLDPIQRKSVSRFLTLSRMIELFFSGWVKQIMSTVQKDDVATELTAMDGVDRGRFERYLRGGHMDFGKIYTVYSGGDDLVLVGPWETMIVFAVFLNRRFRKFTAHNPSITLSAGLAFVKPKLPIATAVRQADDLLTRAKEKGKNRLTLFGTTVEWENLPELIDFFLFLNEKTADRGSRVNSSFLYRLLGYRKMAASFIEDNCVQGLKCLSLLSYDISRNIVRYSQDSKTGIHIESGQEEHRELSRLINARPLKESIWRSLGIPISWCIYRNRGKPDKDNPLDETKDKVHTGGSVSNG